MKRLILILTLMAMFAGMSIGISTAEAEQSSVVVGQIEGTRQPLPGFFRNDISLSYQGIDNVEFFGFRLLRTESGKKYLIRPNKKGYFYQKLPAGRYDLVRIRTDRPDHSEDKVITILSFDVPEQTLVDLGTLRIVIDGEVKEFLTADFRGMEGAYTYNYHYERTGSDSGSRSPVTWFRQKKHKIFSRFGDQIETVELSPTNRVDRSKIVLHENRKGMEN